MKSIIFDLDGTLVDTLPDIHNAANMLLDELGREKISCELARSFIGNGVPIFVTRLLDHAGQTLDKAQTQHCIQRFSDMYRKNLAAQSRPFPGVEETLATLAALGFSLAVCTNKSRALTDILLDRLHLADHFRMVMGGDELPRNKPAPDMLLACMKQLSCARAIFVGDSEIDDATARAARVPFVLFTKGYLKMPLPRPPRAIFSSYDQLPSIVKKLI